MDKIIQILEKIINTNFEGYEFKTTYLYNELFFSIFDKNDFLFVGISYKAENIVTNVYRGNQKNIAILQLIIKKYEDLLIKYLRIKQKNIFKLGNESEFINIYDNEKYTYDKIKNNLAFSFLDDYSYRRKIQNQFGFEGLKILDLYHSDFECSKCSGEKTAFTTFPDYDTIEDSKYFEKSIDEKTFICTNINDYESITIGGNEKINEILSNKEIVDSFDMIQLNKTCISVIMGDDINSIFKYNNVPQEKIFYTDQNTDSPYRMVIDYLKNLELKKSQNKDEIVFFGLSKSKNTFEIIDFLDVNFNIKVGNALLPSINLDDLKTILSYKLAVFFNGREKKAQSLFKLFPLDNISVKTPYGLTNSFNLYKDILLSLGKNDEILKLEKLFDDIKSKNRELFVETDGISIGFIIYSHHLKYFIEDNFRGMSVVSMLKDMLFKLKFLVYNNSESDLINFTLFKQNFTDTEIILTENKSDLDNFLNDKETLLYYSEVANDERIFNNKKIQVSPRDFEYGIEGFFRTQKLLIKKINKGKYINNNF